MIKVLISFFAVTCVSISGMANSKDSRHNFDSSKEKSKYKRVQLQIEAEMDFTAMQRVVPFAGIDDEWSFSWRFVKYNAKIRSYKGIRFGGSRTVALQPLKFADKIYIQSNKFEVLNVKDLNDLYNIDFVLLAYNSGKRSYQRKVEVFRMNLMQLEGVSDSVHVIADVHEIEE